MGKVVCPAIGSALEVMTREKHIGWMRVALAIAEQSKCVRAQYGTVILDSGGRVISTGYNGKPAGSCNDVVCYREGLPPDANKPKCCLHSEQNALVFGNYAEYQGGTLYVSGLPCEDCALLIMQSGVKTLVCLEDERGYDGVNVIQRYGVPLETVVLRREEMGD